MFRPRSPARVTAEFAAEALGLPVLLDDDLKEVRFGVQEGQPMSDWYGDWIAGRFTPEGGETFAALQRRAVAAVNRATAHPPAVLIVAHGAPFRSLRAAMGLDVNQRTQNAVPLFCDPGPEGWTIRVR